MIVVWDMYIFNYLTYSESFSSIGWEFVEQKYKYISCTDVALKSKFAVFLVSFVLFSIISTFDE
jgi:hypothetical protein